MRMRCDEVKPGTEPVDGAGQGQNALFQCDAAGLDNCQGELFQRGSRACWTTDERCIGQSYTSKPSPIESKLYIYTQNVLTPLLQSSPAVLVRCTPAPASVGAGHAVHVQTLASPSPVHATLKFSWQISAVHSVLK